MKKKIHILILFICILCTEKVVAQRQRNTNLFIDIGAAQGEILKTNEYVTGENKYGLPITDYSSADIRLGWQTLGTKQWHHDLLLPYYGVGFHSSYFVNENYFGYPYSLYFFFGGPFVKLNKHAFNYEFSFGLSNNWEHYDQKENPLNLAIGSKQNAYVDVRVFYSLLFFKRMELQAGVRATHFSNGSTKSPNKGLNIISPFVNLRYALTRREIPEDMQIGQYDPTPEFNILLTIGHKAIKDTPIPNSNHAGLITLSLEYLRPAKKIWKYGLGVDLGFDENKAITIMENTVQKASEKKQFFMGSGLIGQFRARNLAVQGDFGLELIARGYDKFRKRIYQKVGLRYYFRQKFIAGIRIKARNFCQADYIEWSIGYSFY